jgi:hypothetical protein
MIIVPCIQRSPEWWRARRGIPTASGFDRILTTKLKPSAGMEKYICELVAERMSEPADDGDQYVSPAMWHGMQAEKEAREWYSLNSEHAVTEVGFCLSDCRRWGCSPDGLVGDEGGLELKCPMLKTHTEYVLKGKVPPKFLSQIHGALLITGRKWWEFVSYAPGLTPLQFRVEPGAHTEALAAALEVFWVKYKDALARVGYRGEVP